MLLWKLAFYYGKKNAVRGSFQVYRHVGKSPTASSTVSNYNNMGRVIVDAVLFVPRQHILFVAHNICFCFCFLFDVFLRVLRCNRLTNTDTSWKRGISIPATLEVQPSGVGTARGRCCSKAVAAGVACTPQLSGGRRNREGSSSRLAAGKGRTKSRYTWCLVCVCVCVFYPRRRFARL